jgi:3D (Asp-Asp-Asp) domain-containing protein
MVKPLKRGFKMNTNLKGPAWGRNFLIILIGVGILVGLCPIFETNSQEVESWVEVWLDREQQPERLAMVGGNSLLPISSPSEPDQVARKIKVVVTAYSSTPAQTDDNPYITAAGTWVREGIVANNMLPFGTKIRIPEIYGDKVFIVEDRMHWKKGYYHVDIWFASYGEAKDFGAKTTFIEVLES